MDPGCEGSMGDSGHIYHRRVVCHLLEFQMAKSGISRHMAQTGEEQMSGSVGSGKKEHRDVSLL